ncbi:MAG: sugar ABC transporter permease [Spirochaetaceae bacterium]|nr:sugar ABC transporter permease [Spirochaetaceae bacterium]
MTRNLSWRGRERLAAALFLLPAVAGILLLRIYPIGSSLLLGLTETKLLGGSEFVGLANYVAALTRPELYRVIFNSAYFAFGSQFLTLIVGLMFAVALNTRLRAIGLYRFIFFFPFVTTWTAVALVWQWFLSTEVGTVNLFLARFGIAPVPWLTSPRYAMLAVIIVFTWKAFGYKMVILLAALQGIPEEYYEAANIDGGSRVQVFFRIVLPLITPAIFFAIVAGIINSLQVFDPIFIMTEGGPARATTTIGYFIYERGFRTFEFGYAAAVSWILFILILLLTLGQWRLQRRWVFYG